jgi:hypothetical protein
MTTKAKPKAKKLDKYDRAIAYLKKHPDEMYDAWRTSLTNVKEHPAHCLFQHVTPTGRSGVVYDHCMAGCLTQIRRRGIFVAATPALTEEIRNDERLPESHRDITIRMLPRFAWWQRRLDKELNRA